MDFSEAQKHLCKIYCARPFRIIFHIRNRMVTGFSKTPKTVTPYFIIDVSTSFERARKFDAKLINDTNTNNFISNEQWSKNCNSKGIWVNYQKHYRNEPYFFCFFFDPKKGNFVSTVFFKSTRQREFWYIYLINILA